MVLHRAVELAAVTGQVEPFLSRMVIQNSGRRRAVNVDPPIESRHMTFLPLFALAWKRRCNPGTSEALEHFAFKGRRERLLRRSSEI
jgi:hypothetical protein